MIGAHRLAVQLKIEAVERLHLGRLSGNALLDQVRHSGRIIGGGIQNHFQLLDLQRLQGPFALQVFLGLGDIVHAAGEGRQRLVGPVGTGGVGGIPLDNFSIGLPLGLRRDVLQFQILGGILVDEGLGLPDQRRVPAATGHDQQNGCHRNKDVFHVCS